MTSPDAAPAPPSGDWPAHAADTVDAVVGLVRDKATVPVQTAARALVYGVALAAVGITTAVLLAAAAVRVLTVYLPVGRAPGHHHRVWVAYLIVGGIFTLSGLFLLRRAESSTREGS